MLIFLLRILAGLILLSSLASAREIRAAKGSKPVPVQVEDEVILPGDNQFKHENAWTFNMDWVSSDKSKDKDDGYYTVKAAEVCTAWKFTPFFIKRSCKESGRHFECEGASGKYKIMSFSTKAECIVRLAAEKDAALQDK